jgi:hypothetical protein
MVAAASPTPAATPLRARRSPAVPVRVVEPIDGPDLLDASLTLAHTQLVGQLADETSLDARTMGTLGFTGALLAADVAAKDLLGVAWWTPLVAIGLATACCLSPALGIGFGFARDTDLGPDPVSFYATYASRPSRAAREQLLRDLVSAFARNAHRLRAKQRALRLSLVILVLGLVASTVAVGIDRSASIGPSHGPHRAST